MPFLLSLYYNMSLFQFILWWIPCLTMVFKYHIVLMSSFNYICYELVCTEHHFKTISVAMSFKCNLTVTHYLQLMLGSDLLSIVWYVVKWICQSHMNEMLVIKVEYQRCATFEAVIPCYLENETKKVTLRDLSPAIVFRMSFDFHH